MAHPLLYSAAVFYRVLVGGIVVFWLWMTILLVRLEWPADEQQGLPVPLPFVWKLVFSHEESSDLVLCAQHSRVGNFHLQPSHLAGDADSGGQPIYQLTAIGNFTLALPGMNHQYVVVHATLKFDPSSQLQRIELSMEFRESREKGSGIVVDLDGRPERNQWHYAVRSGAAVLKENTGSIAAMLDDPDLRILGIDPSALSRWGQSPGGAVKMMARHGGLRLNGEEIETYVVSIKQGDTLETTIHLNQLGQVLAVKTFAGYDLYDEAFAP